MSEDAPAVVAYVAAGSSIDSRRNLTAAIDLLARRVDVLAISTVYKTPAIGRPHDPDFLNCVIKIRTAMPPREVKVSLLKGIENLLSRRRSHDKYAPRRIDLDLILYGDQVIDQPDLTIPHPDLARWFVREPLLELAPSAEMPGVGVKLRDYGLDQPAGNPGKPLPDFTELLRSRLRS